MKILPFFHLLKSRFFEVISHYEEEDSLAKVEVLGSSSNHQFYDRIIIAFVEGNPVVSIIIYPLHQKLDPITEIVSHDQTFLIIF